jgi:SRSO17 transposase
MVSRALEAGLPFAWFTADEVYGQAKWLQSWLEDRGVSYVMAIRRSDTFTMPLVPLLTVGIPGWL